MLPVRRLSDAVGAGVLRVFSPDGRLRSVPAVGRAACLVGCWVSLVLEDLKGILKALKIYQNAALTRLSSAKNHIFGLRIKNDHTRQKTPPDRTDERGTKVIIIMSAVILTPQGVDIE